MTEAMERYALLSAALDRAASEELSAAHARAYFGQNFPNPEPGETTADAIRRAYAADIEMAREDLPKLNPISVRNALSMIDGNPGDTPAAIFKAMQDQSWLDAEETIADA